MFNKIKAMPLSVAVILVFALSTPTFAQTAVVGTDTQIAYPTEISGGVTTTGADPVTTEIYGSTTSKTTKAQCDEWLNQFNSWMSKANDKVAAATSSKDLQVARGFKDSAAGYRNKIAANQSVCDDYADLDKQLAAWRTACLEKNKQFGGGPYTCS